jgi:hypothetical protein
VSVGGSVGGFYLRAVFGVEGLSNGSVGRLFESHFQRWGLLEGLLEGLLAGLACWRVYLRAVFSVGVLPQGLFESHFRR